MAEGLKVIPHDAEWVGTLRHRPDPNRLPEPGGPAAKRAIDRPTLPADPATASPRAVPPSPTAQSQVERPAGERPSYYDVSLLKPPVWKWQIASYFFLGGASAGAFLLARMAERGGGKRYRDLTRVGTYAAMLAALPCAPLLIADLGDPKRLHHMLRVFKPSSPMNLGTWVLTGYSGLAAAAAVREWLAGPHSPDRAAEIRRMESLPGKILLLVQDAAGVPLALLLAAYTGVLISSTANPMWCKNAWIPALFSAGAISAGAAAVTLGLDATGAPVDSPSHRVLRKVHTAAHVAEAVTLAGYVKAAGPGARPLTHGSMRKHLRFSIAATAAAELLQWLPLRGAMRRCARITASLLGLASGFSLRWAFIYGGKEAGNDPDAARRVTGGDGRAG